MHGKTHALAVLLLATALGLLARPGLAPAHGGMKGMGQELPPAELSGNSIYQLGSEWKDVHGAPVPLASLQGHPVVLAMVYTSCEHACPVLVEDMKRIEQTLSPQERAEVIFALFSIDPARDTPAALAAYRADKGLADGRWHLFTGDPDDVLELTVVLGVQYRPDGFGGFSHSNLVSLLDARGVVRSRLVGLHANPAPLLAALHGLLGG
jgi:protein SCO1/2